MRKSSVLLFLVALTLIVGIIGTIGIVNAARGDDKADSYWVCVDKDGNMRLETGKKGKCKKNEFAIELPSIQLISLLEEKIGELEDRITELETPVSNFTITSTAGSGGSIDPDGTVTVNQGGDLTFTITADTGYHIVDVLVDGSSVGALSTYTFPAVTADHTIAAFFEIDGTGDIIQEGLVLYLPLYEYELDGDTIISKDAYGHTCTVTGASWRPSGRYFTGDDDYINIPDAFDSLSEGTLMAWVKLETIDRLHDLFASSYSTPGAKDFLWFTIYNDNKLYLQIQDGGGTNLIVGSTDTTLSVDTWYLVALTMSASGSTIYRDGIAQNVTYSTGDATTQAFFNSISTSQETYIGRFLYSGSYYARMAGWIGEVWIYNRALTPQEILHNYEATKWRYE